MTPRQKKKRMRRPEELRFGYGCGHAIFEGHHTEDGLSIAVYVGVENQEYAALTTPEDCRKLASWLLKAADYLEENKK